MVRPSEIADLIRLLVLQERLSDDQTICDAQFGSDSKDSICNLSDPDLTRLRDICLPISVCNNWLVTFDRCGYDIIKVDHVIQNFMVVNMILVC